MPPRDARGETDSWSAVLSSRTKGLTRKTKEKEALPIRGVPSGYAHQDLRSMGLTRDESESSAHVEPEEYPSDDVEEVTVEHRAAKAEPRPYQHLPTRADKSECDPSPLEDDLYRRYQSSRNHDC